VLVLSDEALTVAVLAKFGSVAEAANMLVGENKRASIGTSRVNATIGRR
jgi:hypothetical protein